jgi:hypothetical protein
MVSKNNIDLARNRAEPACTKNAITDWVNDSSHHGIEHEWIHRRSTRNLLSLGLNIDEIKFGKRDKLWIGSKTIRDWVEDAEHSEILLLLQMVTTPPDISDENFSTSFHLRDNVIDLSQYGIDRGRHRFALGDWVEKMFPLDEMSTPRTVPIAVLRKILQAFPSASVDERDCLIGHVNGTYEIFENCYQISNLK